MGEGKISVPPTVVVADLSISQDVDERLGLPIAAMTMDVRFIFTPQIPDRPPTPEEMVEALRKAMASVLPAQPKEPRPAMKLCFCGWSARLSGPLESVYFYCSNCTRRAPTAGSRDGAIMAWNWMVQDTKDAIELAKRKHMTEKGK